MNPSEIAIIISTFSSLVDAVEKLAPVYKSLTQSGAVTVDQQNAQFERISKILDGSAFAGPEYKQ